MNIFGNHKTSIAAVCLGIVLPCLAFGAAAAQSAGSDGQFNLVNAGEFTYAASGELKPFSFMKNGKMVGFDISVGKAIAKQLGLQPNPQKSKFSGIIIGVKHGRYDAGVASQTITKKREKQVNFSVPYYYTGPVIFTRPDSKIRTAKDLSGKVVAVSRGSTFVHMAKEYTNHVRQFDSDVVALEALASGHYDAVITGRTTGAYAIKNGLDLVPRAQLGTARIAVTVAKGNKQLLHSIDEAIKHLRSSGELKKLSIKWIGTDITEPPAKTN